MKKFPKLSITVQILLALVLACIVGYFLQNTPDIADLYIKPFGTIFLNLLKFIVVPLGSLSFSARRAITPLPVTHSIRLTPEATEDSETILKSPTFAVLST